ncbi:hypothetical protein [Flavobacterium johnsoniae]|uniref:hypothetical protein n=1 Tax=Flavobacterium johnsoniae TaxID=986 RepID=UPI0011F01D4D|nr:hypothetical protein [Flavobacterium johnsoniae]
MNICKWCNAKVADSDTVWYRRNLVLGYSFCSNKCATQWKNSNQDSQSKANDSSHNLPSDVSSNENFDFGSFITKPKENNDLNAELKSIQALQKQLRGQKANDNISDQENAKKIMSIVRKLLPHWKIIVSILIGILAVAFYLNTMYGQILSYILIVLIIGLVWAYFTEPKE